MSKFCLLSGEREPRRLIFLNFYFKLIAALPIYFWERFDSDKQGK